jgi:hypothetical protein
VPILPTSQFQICFHESPEWTSEHHASRVTSLPTPLEHNKVQTLGRLKQSPPPTKLKSINSKLKSNTNSWGGVEHWTCAGEQKWDKEPNSQWTNKDKTPKAESGDWAISQFPKVNFKLTLVK